jgi:hypothetical protein
MTVRETTTEQPSRFVMSRSRGAVTGFLLVLLGIWGAIIPFVGHSFGYGFTPDNTWTWTAARGWLEVLPGVATFVGGVLVTTSTHRLSATFGAWLAAASGAWFVLGTTLAPFWSAGNIGVPSGSGHHTVYEQLGMFSGLGVVIVLLAAIAIGRASIVGVRDVTAAQSRIDAEREVVVIPPAEGVDDRPVSNVDLPATAATTMNPDGTTTTTTTREEQTTSPITSPM